MKKQRHTFIGITLGDPGGIGPELTLKAVRRRWPTDLRFVLIGSSHILRQAATGLTPRPTFPPPIRWSTSPLRGKWPLDPLSRADVAMFEPSPHTNPPKTTLWDPHPFPRLRATPGKTGAASGRAAAAWIEAATRACMAGALDAMVTGPICKQSLHKAGIHVPGHTEYLARLTHTKSFAMLLMGGPLRVVLVTRHVPIRDVRTELTRSKVLEAIMLSAAALPWLGLGRDTIGVCALNPHAGEGGILGDAEKKIIAPAIRAARRKGLNVEGPVPADVMFYKARRGAYAIVVAMYHDQGLAPLKLLAFDTGVNITLGLPIVRTSPDHGTAFDIAGKGVANPASMINAIRTAYELAKKRNPWNLEERTANGRE